jgi:hypothetical protein
VNNSSPSWDVLAGAARRLAPRPPHLGPRVQHPRDGDPRPRDAHPPPGQQQRRHLHVVGDVDADVAGERHLQSSFRTYDFDTNDAPGVAALGRHEPPLAVETHHHQEQLPGLTEVPQKETAE